MTLNCKLVLVLRIFASALHTSVESFAPTSLRLRVLPYYSTSSSLASLSDASDEHVPSSHRDNLNEELRNSRRFFLSATATTASQLIPLCAYASPDKQTNISNDELKQIILTDILERSFLVSADITRSVYDESATFTDEIDVYTMDKWIKGTKALFIPSGSSVKLVGDVDVTKSEVSFRFDEDLMFNIPFKPVCSLTGKVVLTRDENTGLIKSYHEYWDQSVNEVLKTAKFGKKA